MSFSDEIRRFIRVPTGSLLSPLLNSKSSVEVPVYTLQVTREEGR